jgi:hypothetical protein
MLSLLMRKATPPAPVEEVAPMEPNAFEPVKRSQQQNIKASEDCCATFAAIAKAQGLSKSALFEDMVAERLEALQSRGVVVEISNR